MYLLPSASKLRRLCFYTCLWFCSQGGGGVLSQHALQVVSQHALQQGDACSWGCACSRGGGLLPEGGSALGVLLRGGGGDLPPQSRRLLLRTVRILLECIFVSEIISPCEMIFLCRSNFLHFHAVFGTKWPNNMLAPPLWSLVPLFGKSWIRHCIYYRPQRICEGYVFTDVCLSMGGLVGGGVVSQHALQVSQAHTQGGSLGGSGWGGVSRPTPKGEVEGNLV